MSEVDIFYKMEERKFIQEATGLPYRTKLETLKNLSEIELNLRKKQKEIAQYFLYTILCAFLILTMFVMLSNTLRY